MSRRRLLIILLLAIPLAGQQAEPPDDDDGDQGAITVSVRTTALGNVHLHFYGNARNLEVIPGALNCSWVSARSSGYGVSGTCRGWLSPAESSLATLHLAPLVEALERHGAKRVDINLAAAGKLTNPPDGWQREEGGGRSWSSLSFSAKTPGQLPADVAIPLSRPPKLWFPIALVFSIPVLIAWAVRGKARAASADRKLNWIVWMNWSSLGIWLYWISVVNPTELADYLLLLAPLGNILTLVIGVAIYSGPPLLSVCCCLAAMAPLFSSSREGLWLLLRQQFVAQATFQVPLGIFLVGAGGADWAGPTFSLVAAYVVYRSLVWLNWTMSYSEVTPLESGDLFERASALARKAGVTLSRLGMLRTRLRDQANAFAMSGDKIVLTETLVRGLTPREVDAVIAHELGHHKAGHLRFNTSQILFWAFILGVGPGLSWLVLNFHLATWWLNIPLLPLGLVLLQAFVSQRRELEADARAVAITGDAEGKIAALSRLAQLSRVPVEGRGIMGSIMSHPSMENRILALARRYGVPESRALAILRDPDEAYTEQMWHLDREPGATPGVEGAANDPVFNLRARVGYMELSRWLTLLVPPVSAFLLTLVLDKFLVPSSEIYFFGRYILLFILLLAVAPIFLVGLAAGDVASKLFFARMKRKIASCLTPETHATFAGIHPGRGVRYTEGFADWDLGFVTLQDDWFVYRGEKARFALASHEILETQIVRDPLRWRRDHRLEIVTRSGVFTLTTDCARPTRAAAESAQRWISEWLAERASTNCATFAPEPPLRLPRVPGAASNRMNLIWYLVKTTLKIWLGAPLLFLTGWGGYVVGPVLLMFAAPLAVFVRFLPFLIWPTRLLPDSEGATKREPEPATVGVVAGSI